MTRHNYGDISSETHSNDKRANEESHLSESIETITARRRTEGEASSEQDSRQDIQENRIEESTFGHRQLFLHAPSIKRARQCDNGFN